MLGVALLSAAVAGGSAYFLARGHAAAPVAGSTAATPVTVLVQIEPADATVVTHDGVVPAIGGQVRLRGNAGETVNVTVQRGSASKAFSVSLGSDGIATPSRLVLTPQNR
jgi:hypothetical protein